MRSLDPRKAFLLKFVILIVAFYGAIVIPFVDRHFVRTLTETIASATGIVLRAVGQAVSVDGTVVGGGGAAVDIVNGCNGLEAAVLLFAAVLAFPAGWRSRGLAIVVGFAGIQLLNLVRTSSLYLFLKYRPGWFDVMHTGVWQTILVVAALGYFVFWSSRQRVGSNEERAA
jgi:exosortase H (IPTLxxWG-CTERM-specific)